METVVRPHAKNLVRWAKDRPRVLVLSADLTANCEVNDFKKAYPDRFLSLGMAEQNLMGFAAGLAREGFEPWIHTFAVFLTRRPFDQVAMSIAYPNLRVRLVGFVPGITTPGGVTHQAIDDLGLMRLLPNMTVLSCGDATEVETVLDAASAVDGPVYVRMLRKEVPRLFPLDEPFEIGRARSLSPGTEVVVLSEGICTEEVLPLTRPLAEHGIGHWHVPTLKPFPDERVRRALREARRGVVTVENHSVIGGLGSAVAEVMAGDGARARLLRLGLQDTYAHGASQAYLVRKYGLGRQALLEAVEGILGERLGLDLRGIQAAEPGAVPLPAAAVASERGREV